MRKCGQTKNLDLSYKGIDLHERFMRLRWENCQLNKATHRNGACLLSLKQVVRVGVCRVCTTSIRRRCPRRGIFDKVPNTRRAQSTSSTLASRKLQDLERTS